MSTLTIPDVSVTPPNNEANETHYICHRCGHKHVRMTKIIDECFPKYALPPWAEKIGHQAMYKILTETPGLTLEEARKRIKLRGLTQEDAKNKGGERGGYVHDFLEQYVALGQLPSMDPSMPVEYQPYLHSLTKFLADYEPEFLGSEFYIVHCEQSYAGRVDGICRIGKQPPRRNKPIDLTDKLCLFDVKTNKDGKVYPPGHLYQVAGYRQAWDWLGGEELDHEIVIGVGPDSYQVKPSKYDPRCFADVARFYHSMKEQQS